MQDAGQQIKCHNCGFENPASAKFCQNCGTELATAPPALPARPALHTHLPRPGTLTQQLTSERRIVTILFADIVGSTALAELLDPEDWTEIMGGAFEFLISAVTRYEGTVARLMGDAILALFGAPVAHEDDPFRAIRAGLDILDDLQPYQQETRRRLTAAGLQPDPTDFEVRLGINTGLVVVGSVGTGEMSEYTAMGDAVNVAARMEQTARPGTVQIAQDTYRQVAALIESESLGGIEVKGKREPVPSYQVLGLKSKPGRQRGIEGAETPLIGRERELSLLRGTLIDLGQGFGQIVTVIGDAGLGKSRLTRELNLEVQNSGLDVVWFEVASLSFEGGQPYGLIQRLMRELLGAEADESAEVVQEKIGELSESVELEARPQVIRALEALFGLDVSDGRTRPEGESLKRDIFAATAALWRARARQGPIILLFDDLHWADPASVELIRDMLPLAWVAPVLFLCVFRPDRDSVVWQIPQAAQEDDIVRYLEIRLNPLTPEESTALTGSLLAFSDVPEKVAKLVLDKAEGIPFFVEEIVRELIESGVLVPKEDGGWRLASELGDVQVPENLEALLVARMDRLPRSVRRTLQRASVIGRTFDYRILKNISRNPDLLEDNLVALVQAGLIRDSSRGSEHQYTFHHALTGQAIYDTILRSRRREFHRQTGEAIEHLFPEKLADNTAQIARHFQLAGDYARALKYFEAAAENAISLYANSEAAAHYSSAIEVANEAALDAATLAELHRKRGLVYVTLGDFDRALADHEAALALAQSAGERQSEWQTLLDLGELWSSRDYERTGAYFRQALDLARETGDLSFLASSLNRVGNWHVNVEQPAEGMRFHREAQEIFERLGDRVGAAGTLDLMGMANLIGGDMVAGDGYYGRAINLFRELDDQQGLVSSLTAAGMSGGGAGSVGTSLPAITLSEGISRGLQALQLAQKIGWPAGESFAMWSLAQSYGAQGRFTQALEYGREALQVAVDIEHLQWMAGSHDVLGRLYVELVAMQKAQEHFREAVRLAHEVGSQNWVRVARSGQAMTLLLTGELEEAKATLEVAIGPDTPSRTIGQRSCWLTRATVALAEGRPGRALEIADRLIESEPNLRPGQVITSLWLLRGDALAALGQTAEAERLYLAGIENGRARGERILLWHLHRSLGQLYLAAGRPADAEKSFSDAVTLIESLADTVPEKALRENFLRRAKAMATGSGRGSGRSADLD
jgi:class 3 adenylate cyclase/tetratricopeptide (TPR) repeat protein